MAERPASWADLLASAPLAERGPRWLRLADELDDEGRGAQALVAARTGLALMQRLSADLPAVRAASKRVTELSAGLVVPMTVGVPSAAGPADDPHEGRAVWIGTPAASVLSMLGWVELYGTLRVVRVVVPETRRGRAAFTVLLDALPTCVPVAARLPQRDGGVLRTCVRAGFTVDPASIRSGGYRGGSVNADRPADPAPGGAR